MSLVTWLKESFNGEDGKASGKRITAFTFVALSVMIVLCILCLTYLIMSGRYKYEYRDVMKYSVTTLYICCGMILLLWGVVTFAQIIQFKNGGGDLPGANQDQDKKDVK